MKKPKYHKSQSGILPAYFCRRHIWSQTPSNLSAITPTYTSGQCVNYSVLQMTLVQEFSLPTNRKGEGCMEGRCLVSQEPLLGMADAQCTEGRGRCLLSAIYCILNLHCRYHQQRPSPNFQVMRWRLGLFNVSLTTSWISCSYATAVY